MNIKATAKKFAKKIPFAKDLRNRYRAFSGYKRRLSSDKLINKRLEKKRRTGEKINVVFICHRPAVWESLHSVYDALVQDQHFNVTIVAIPNKKELPGLWLDHETYESEGAEEFWKEYGCIHGYDYQTKKWLDLRTLKPDYVFFQQPYNIKMCAEYKSWKVSRYAKLLFVTYAINIIGGEPMESTYPPDFMNDVSIFFCPNTSLKADLQEWFSKNNNRGLTKIVVSGFPRYDQFEKPLDKEPDIWKHKGKKFRVIWTPRWNTREGSCTFFEYKDAILEYARSHDDVEIVFRPHPQAFSEYNFTGEMPEEEQRRFRKDCDSAGITIDEDGEYLSKIRTTDCFLTDPTSLMGEYIATAKPILYTHKINCFASFGNALAEGYYYCKTWSEIENTLNMLKKGDDPLAEVRARVCKENISVPVGGAGNYIKNEMLKDAGY